MKITKEYTCEIKLHFVGNNREANSIEEYKQLINQLKKEQKDDNI